MSRCTSIERFVKSPHFLKNIPSESHVSSRSRGSSSGRAMGIKTKPFAAKTSTKTAQFFESFLGFRFEFERHCQPGNGQGQRFSKICCEGPQPARISHRIIVDKCHHLSRSLSERTVPGAIQSRFVLANVSNATLRL